MTIPEALFFLIFNISTLRKLKNRKYQNISSCHDKLNPYLSIRRLARGRISNRVFQENKESQIFRKTKISYPLIRTRTCAYQAVRNVRSSGNLVCFVFLKHPFWDGYFYLITDEIWSRKIYLSPSSKLRYYFLKHWWELPPSYFCFSDWAWNLPY